MATDEEIRTALDRTRRAIELRPSIALGTIKSNTRLEEGLKCVSRSGDWTFEIDEPAAVGGDNSAPSPGVYGLGALTGCIAMAVKNCAVLSDISIATVEVDVEADYDERGVFNIDGVAPGFKEFRLFIKVDSNAPREKVIEIIKTALKTDTWFAVFTDSQKISTEISMTTRQTEQDS